jgi:glucose/arabinose dehydrogenase
LTPREAAFLLADKKVAILKMVIIRYLKSVAIVLLAACASPIVTPTPELTSAPNPPVSLQDRVASIPAGFDIAVYGSVGSSGVSVLTFGPDRNLYILTVDGQIFRLRDTNGDTVADARDLLYGDEDNLFNHAVGMAFSPDGTLFVSDSGRISRVEDENRDGKFDLIKPIIEGLPSLLYPLHSNNGIAFDLFGKLYVAVGSTTDHGPLKVNREASILRMNDDGRDVEVFASGFRNPYDLAFAPNGDLFTADNSPDQLDMTLRYLPPEELDHVRQGRDYGFPNAFGFMRPAGDESEPPITEFFTSVVSAGLVYYSGDSFPPAYRDGVFVAQFGSAAAAPIDRQLRNGFAVVFVGLTPTADGTYTGDFEPFIVFNPGKARPVDVTVGPDDALYILEFSSGEVYRVRYRG